MKTEMRCPVFGEPLVEDAGRRYGTWAEDVLDPNRYPGLKPTYISEHTKIFGWYDIDGYFHFHKDVSEEDRKFFSDRDLTLAKNSWARRMRAEDRFGVKRIAIFRLPKLKVEIHVKARADGNGKIRKLNFSKEVLIRDGNSWTYHVGFWRMFKHAVQSFKNIKRRYSDNPGNNHIQDELKKFIDDNEYPNNFNLNKTWYRLSRFYIKNRWGNFISTFEAKRMLQEQ